MRTVHHIEAPVEKVFDFFFDPRKSADMSAGGLGEEIRDVTFIEGGTGSHYSWRMKMGGITLPFEGFEVYTDVVPNKHLVEKSSSAMVGTWDFTFEPEGTGTKVISEHHSRSLWSKPPLRSLVAFVEPRLSDAFMRQMKKRLEAAAS